MFVAVLFFCCRVFRIFRGHPLQFFGHSSNSTSEPLETLGHLNNFKTTPPKAPPFKHLLGQNFQRHPAPASCLRATMLPAKVAAMTFAEKVENHAARRLAIPQFHTPAQEIARYKDFLKVESHRVHLLHKRGESGRAVCQARATALDVLLRAILAAIERNLKAQHSDIPKYALVALGGYGRDELNPHSDIDILFLHETDQVTAGRAKPSLKAIAEGVLYVLWDCCLKVGPAVRSAEDCVNEANSNMQSKTALIEARLVAGDAALFKKMRDLVIAKCVRGYEKQYIQARLEDQEARRAKHGN